MARQGEGSTWTARRSVPVKQLRTNIGARRPDTVLEKQLENLAFDDPSAAPSPVVIDQRCVANKLVGLVANPNISRFIP